MKRFLCVIGLAASLGRAIPTQAACTGYPYGVVVSPPSSTAVIGESLTFQLGTVPSYFPPFVPAYSFQPCDTATWDFGDGTPSVTQPALQPVSHVFNTRGYRRISVDVFTDQSHTIAASWVNVSTNPATIVTIGDVAASESDPYVDVPFTRSGNTTSAATVAFDLGVVPFNGFFRGLEAVGGTVTFAPGETQKFVRIRVENNDLWDGYDNVRGINATTTDGTFVKGGFASPDQARTTADIRIHDDDPRPTASIHDTTVIEGTGGETFAQFTFTASAPIGHNVYYDVVITPQTAEEGVDYLVRPLWLDFFLNAGSTSAIYFVPIVPDAIHEGDETFSISIKDRYGSGPQLVQTVAICTIIDDDAGLLVVTPSSLTLRPGATGTLAIALQPPFGAPQTVLLAASDASIVGVPSTAIVPAAGSVHVPLQALHSGAATVSVFFGNTSLLVPVNVDDRALTIDAIIPASASPAGGTRLTIRGTGLGQTCTVMFGGLAGTSVSVSGHDLLVTTPPHPPGAVDVRVSCGDQRAAVSGGFTFMALKRRAS